MTVSVSSRTRANVCVLCFVFRHAHSLTHLLSCYIRCIYYHHCHLSFPSFRVSACVHDKFIYGKRNEATACGSKWRGQQILYTYINIYIHYIVYNTKYNVYMAGNTISCRHFVVFERSLWNFCLFRIQIRYYYTIIFFIFDRNAKTIGQLVN